MKCDCSQSIIDPGEEEPADEWTGFEGYMWTNKWQHNQRVRYRSSAYTKKEPTMSFIYRRHQYREAGQQELDIRFANAVYGAAQKIQEWVRFGARLRRLAKQLEDTGSPSLIDEEIAQQVEDLSAKIQQQTATEIRAVKNLEMDIKHLLRLAQGHSR